MFYLDHYRFLYKHRREHYSRRKYQARSVLFVFFFGSLEDKDSEERRYIEKKQGQLEGSVQHVSWSPYLRYSIFPAFILTKLQTLPI